MHAPPPPPVQKKPIPWLPILLILGVGFAIVAGICGFGIYSISQMMKEPPRAKQGSGKPVVVGEQGPGWTRYSFAEGPFEMDLPGQPEFSPIEWEQIDSILYSAWTAYEIESDYADLWFAAYWYRSYDFVDLREEVEGATYWFQEDSTVTDVKTDYKATTIADKKGQELICTYKKDNAQWALRAFAWSKGRVVYYLQTYYHPDDSTEAVQEFHRVIKSVDTK